MDLLSYSTEMTIEKHLLDPTWCDMQFFVVVLLVQIFRLSDVR
jgi:hypothetical protein